MRITNRILPEIPNIHVNKNVVILTRSLLFFKRNRFAVQNTFPATHKKFFRLDSSPNRIHPVQVQQIIRDILNRRDSVFRARRVSPAAILSGAVPIKRRRGYFSQTFFRTLWPERWRKKPDGETV